MATLAAWDVEARHPDDFVVSHIDLDSGAVVGAIMQQAAALRNPTRTPEEVLATGGFSRTTRSRNGSPRI